MNGIAPFQLTDTQKDFTDIDVNADTPGLTVFTAYREKISPDEKDIELKCPMEEQFLWMVDKWKGLWTFTTDEECTVGEK